MADTSDNAGSETVEHPLDPASERLRRRLVRFMIVNLTIIFGLILIVVAAIIYRNNFADEVAEPTPGVETNVPAPVSGTAFALRAGEEIVQMESDGDRVTLYLTSAGGGGRIVQIDMRTGVVANSITLQDIAE